MNKEKFSTKFKASQNIVRKSQSCEGVFNCKNTFWKSWRWNECPHFSLCELFSNFQVTQPTLHRVISLAICLLINMYFALIELIMFAFIYLFIGLLSDILSLWLNGKFCEGRTVSVLFTATASALGHLGCAYSMQTNIYKIEVRLYSLIGLPINIFI